MDNRNYRILQITRTGLLLALLIALQWLTAGTQAFAGQYITGTCVNCVLVIAALFGGLWSGLVVALVSPFAAFLLGIGPKFLQIVPCIAIGNGVLVILMHLLLGRKVQSVWQKIWRLCVSAAGKFAVLYVSVVWIVIPTMAGILLPKQVQTFFVMFSWPQLVTALLGGTVALLLLPILRKVRK